MDTVRGSGSQYAKESEDLLLHVLVQLVPLLLLTHASIEQAHVNLAHGRVERGHADGIAHEPVGLLDVVQLNSGREAHVRAPLRGGSSTRAGASSPLCAFQLRAGCRLRCGV